MLLFQAAYSQNTFHKFYGKNSFDEGMSVCITNVGDYVVTGGINASSVHTGGDVYVVRTNGSGDTLWTRTIIMGDEGIGRCVRQTYDGGFVITGGFHNNHNTSSVFLIKLNENGEVLWSKILFEEVGAWSFCVEQTLDTGFVITGGYLKYQVADQVNTQMILIKTDRLGDVIWMKEYGGPQEEQARSVAQTIDGGYAIFGYTGSYGGGDEFYLVRTNREGDSLWSKWYGTYNWDYWEYGLELNQTLDTGFIMVGTSYYQDISANIFLVKTDKYGDTLWTRLFDEFPGASGSSVQQTSDLGYIIGGWSKVGSKHWSLLLLKLDQTGDILWHRSFEDDESRGYAVRQTEDDGYIITGKQEITESNWDVVLIRTDAEGLVSSDEHIMPEGVTLSVYPNPFTTSITFRYTLEKPEDVVISIHSLQGQMLMGIHERQEKGEQEVEWYAEGLPPGIYFYRLQAGNQQATGKMVVLR
jgi:hypothetical protein